MSPHSAVFQDALNAMLCFTCWHGDTVWIPLERSMPSGPPRRFWMPGRGGERRRRFVRMVQRLDESHSPEITFGLPRSKPGWGTVGTVTVLWCRVEGSDQLARARRFRPLPTVVLQEGSSSRRLLVWALDRPLTWADAKRANRRIAYRLRAVQKHADADELAIPAPGTCLRLGRSRPVPVRVARLDLDAMYAPAVVMGALKDPPDQKWWERAS